MKYISRKKLSLISIPILLTFLWGCFPAAKRIDRLWFFTYTSGSVMQDSMTPANFINIQSDGSYSRDWGRFEYGTWKYNGNQLQLISSEKKTTVIAVKYLTSKEMQLSADYGSIYNFDSQPAGFSASSQNPFSEENNRWRMQAMKKESENDIKRRLQNHFRFWEKYFTWALDNKIDYIDVRSTPTPLKIYGNGFTLKPYESLPASWKGYFYDEEDCQRANDQIKYIFEHGNIAWPHTENKYKVFISAFQQLQSKLH